MNRSVAAALALFASGAAAAQEESAAQAALSGAIDALFSEWDSPDSPGAAVAVIHDGELVHSAGYGIAQLEYGIPIDPATTVFHAASVSKQFTAMAAVLLAADGKLSLDDEVRAHVPEVPEFDAPITLRHLLWHTSGLRDQWAALVIAGWRLDDVITTEHILEMVARQRELNFPPGERKLYCNTGYTLLAEVVDRVSGTPFPAFTQERIFAPLGMDRTHFHDDHTHIVPGRAYSYAAKRGGGFQKAVLSYANAGATSLFTTAEDLARWLDGFAHQRVGGDAAYAELLARGRLNDGTETTYAGGIGYGRYRGHERLGHDGADAGFRSAAVWFPAERLGVAVVSNLAGFPAWGKACEVAGLLLPQADPGDAPAEASAPHEDTAEPEPLDIPEERLALYAGSYATEHGFPITIESREGGLVARGVRGARRRLVAESETSFGSPDGELHLSFTLEGGAVDELLFRTGSRTFRLERVAEGEAPAPDLSAFAGRYECPELESLYRIELDGSDLEFVHRRHGRFGLQPTEPDTFRTRAWFLRRLEFTRDEHGRIDGFRLQTERVKNLRFERLAN